MANTGTSALNPSFWSLAFDELDMGEFQFQNLVSRDTERQLASAGTTVRVPLTPDFGDSDVYTPGTAPTVTNVAQEYVDVVLDKSRNKTFQLNDNELSLNPYTLIERYGIPAAKALLRTLNKDVYIELIKSHYLIDATGGLTEDKIIDATVLLSKNEVTKNARTLVASNDAYGDMLKLAGFKQFYDSNDPAVKAKGILGMKYGLEMRENNAIATYTPADLTGAVNNGAGYVLGDKTMIVDGFADSANPLRAGDVFTVAGETGTPKHVVQSTVQTLGATTSITFEPALAGAVADNAVITVVATQSMVAFVPQAAALAARAYGRLPEGSGARTEIISWMGLPIRVSTWVSNLVVNVQYDILYGVKLVKASRVVRILHT